MSISRMSMSQYATLQDYIDARFGAQEKPVVHYFPLPNEEIVVGHRAWVYAVDHYRLGEQEVWTSGVQSYDAETGVFETHYTIYKPFKPVDTAEQTAV